MEALLEEWPNNHFLKPGGEMRIITVAFLIAVPISGVSFAQEVPTSAPGDYGWVWVEANIGYSPSFFLKGEWFDDRTRQWVSEIGWVRGNGLCYRGWIYVTENDLHNFRGRVISPYTVFVDGMVESARAASGLEKKTDWISVPRSGIVVHGRLFIPSAEGDEKDRRQREEEKQRREDERKVQALVYSLLIGLVVFGVLFGFSRLIGKGQEKELPRRKEEGTKQEKKPFVKDAIIVQPEHIQTAPPSPEIPYRKEMATSEEEFYEMAFREVAENQVLAGIWAQAFSLAEGDEQKAKALYLKLRVDQLIRNSPRPIASHFKENLSLAERNTSEAKRNNSMAVTGFCLGLISVGFFWIGIVPLLAVVFSSIGLATFKPEIQKNKWMAGVGLALGVIYTLISITQAR